MRIEKYILWLIALALGIKLVLFCHIACVDPTSIMQSDSFGYLTDAKAWAHYFSMPSKALSIAFTALLAIHSFWPYFILD